MMRTSFVTLALGVCTLSAVSCSQPKLDATFTSQIVQHDVCKVVGNHEQVCDKQDATDDVRVELIEDDDDNVWLYGVPLLGHTDRAILGTKDSSGGFLFVDQTTSTNAASKCTLTDRVEISLAVDPTADAKKVGADPCVALVGRENETTSSSAGCDAVDNPPLPTVQTVARRWEKPQACTP